MKKIGIDARLYSQTGVGTYLQNLLFFLDKKNPKDKIYYIYLREKDASNLRFKSKNLIKRIADYQWHSFSEQISFYRLLIKDNLDLMHFTYFSYPVLYRRKFIITIHDLTPLLFKTGKASTKNPLIYKLKYLFFKKVLSSQIKNSSAIITPSKSIKKQIVKYYGGKYQKKIFPIYEGVNHQLFRAKENQELKKKFSKLFFIYVGNFYPHKNVERLIKSFSKIGEDIQLILLGPNDYFQSKIVQLINQLYMKDKVVFYNNPTYADLIFFYRNTQALIHPSMSEGFGLPLIEAAYFNCSVIASDIPVFKEILGNSYLSFDPYSVDDITKKIEYFLEKKPKYDYKDIVNKYSFEKMAKETLKIYDKFL
ncbi:hypothetical protein COW98_03770 [Candidatus Roizmanbacteria bacterium CG22_combo_CG10-13_8_21_14_all_35_9]|uniref:Glycosyl transferase family 1 domain-containing protein n=4 Tax=Candidatus Roizmaniibacteriota TaxID=1752723 RepID=A0A2M8F4P4_9BACT|nr:MAG: hypothetical protein COX47_00960 [Candidatus Roizmanbacteria bacterium CG23_combo_of_CG06-09_8_20_14_all_35_49]PIP62487.1 MAG: hypothetical protein COW98_03770 [Candidatus Roizmanbacteria bacterium CG22_combo_CG10-13_8_21_14_all_35_9]PIY70854.1 MAG: hypothetical protein COY88_03405 [Candidatus Roizmanbacteria bacterium CG_4_10_14_0_8_um_filter_35_28]PJC34265.1 MAG: hypothetical protein CO048_00720 [Candidatus Roizmanbacteria bacterium CG_4_9_14_0_2_um_filter_35_15]PJC82591.1 MAG: hypoth